MVIRQDEWGAVALGSWNLQREVDAPERDGSEGWKTNRTKRQCLSGKLEIFLTKPAAPVHFYKAV